jgi:hypothetical protein
VSILRLDKTSASVRRYYRRISRFLPWRDRKLAVRSAFEERDSTCLGLQSYPGLCESFSTRPFVGDPAGGPCRIGDRVPPALLLLPALVLYMVATSPGFSRVSLPMLARISTISKTIDNTIRKFRPADCSLLSRPSCEKAAKGAQSPVTPGDRVASNVLHVQPSRRSV